MRDETILAALTVLNETLDKLAKVVPTIVDGVGWSRVYRETVLAALPLYKTSAEAIAVAKEAADAVYENGKKLAKALED